MLPSRLLLVSVFSFVLGLPVAGFADDPIAAKFDKARQQYEKSQSEVREKVLRYFDDRKDAARKSGNLAMQTSLQEQREKFEQTGIIPGEAPTAFYRQAMIAHVAFESACEAAIKSHTQAGHTAEAKQTQELLEKLRQIGLERATRFSGSVRISAKSEVGYDLRKISKGDRIRINYLSGKWKGWGNVASDSPDDTVLEKGERNRLAICEADGLGHTRVLMIVPPDTRHHPFEMIASRHYERVVLRINDDDNDFASNPDDDVTYNLQILRGY